MSEVYCRAQSNKTMLSSLQDIDQAMVVMIDFNNNSCDSIQHTDTTSIHANSKHIYITMMTLFD